MPMTSEGIYPVAKKKLGAGKKPDLLDKKLLMCKMTIDSVLNVLD